MKVLILDDERDALEAMVALVEGEGWDVLAAGSIREAREHLERTTVDLAILDLQLPDGESLELLPELSRPGTEIVFVSGHGSIDSAVEALKGGATDFLEKPIEVRRLKALMGRVRDTRDLRHELNRLGERAIEQGRLGPMLGGSPAMRRVYESILRVAPTEASVLVAGPTGTGKELVAQTIHALSERSSGPFVAVNCGAIPATLIESELFGHERGAFTGADRRHRGVFERASGGTLFLDEITEMPPEMQVKLLRVLESGELTRLGAESSLEVDARVIAATNRDPSRAVESGRLREDLYYRLNVFRIDLPGLVDREGDVRRLARGFVDVLNQGDVAKELGEDALQKLERHDWPGNVRELRHVLERAHILADETIGAEHVVFGAPSEQPGLYVRAKVGTPIEHMERSLIEATLGHLEGNKREAARQLGISLKTLYNRLNAYQAEQDEAGGPVRGRERDDAGA